MTIIRLREGSLILHSPTRSDSALRRSLDEIGTITHVIAPNSGHWKFVKQWQDHYPVIQTWAAPGLAKRRQVRRAGVPAGL
jgi:hypothetical protein